MINLTPTKAAKTEMQDRGIDDRRIWVRRCDMGELPDMHTLGPPSDLNRLQWEETGRRYEGPDVLDWFGISSHAALGKMVRQGYPEGAKQGLELAAKIEREMPEPVSRKRKLTWQESGDELNRDRVYSGQLEIAWRGTKRRIQRAPQILSIVAPWGANCTVTAESIFHSAAAVIALTDLLEKAGYGVEIRALAISSHYDYKDGDGNNHYTATEVMVKHPAEPLRADAVAATFHAATFRYYGIRSWGGTTLGAVNDGWGSVVENTTGLQYLVDAKLADPAHLIISRVSTADAAQDEVKQQLENLESGNLALLDA